MTFRTIEPAQRTAAKVAGWLYLIQMATAIFGESFVRGRLIVPGDAVQTAANIAESEQLFRLSVVSDLITYASVIVLVWALYVVLCPVQKYGALLAAFLRLVENAVLAGTTLNAFVALRLLGGSAYLRVVGEEELQALARVFLGMYGTGLSVGFVFTGLGSAVFSFLWLKSRYIPRALAGWGIFSSLVLASVTLVIMVFPNVASIGLSYMVPMFFYEVGLGVWLIVKGIRTPTGEGAA